MRYVCQSCGYVSEEYISECPDCGGFVEEEIPKVDWLGEGTDESYDNVRDKEKPKDV